MACFKIEFRAPIHSFKSKFYLKEKYLFKTSWGLWPCYSEKACQDGWFPGRFVQILRRIWCPLWSNKMYLAFIFKTFLLEDVEKLTLEIIEVFLNEEQSLKFFDGLLAAWFWHQKILSVPNNGLRPILLNPAAQKVTFFCPQSRGCVGWVTTF